MHWDSIRAFLLGGLYEIAGVAPEPTRVVEREYDAGMGCQLERESYGTVIDGKEDYLHGAGRVPYWLIKWDDKGPDEWYPRCFFSWQDNDGTWVRSM